MARLVLIDTENLERILDSIGSKARNRVGRILEWQLSKHSNELAKKLNENAPSQIRGDSRYKTKLNQSFYVTGYIGARVVETSEPRKLSLVSLPTGEHPIFPRFKKALFWPGLLHPVSWVLHPGTRGNDFVERTLDEVGLTPDPQVIANMIAEEITGYEPWEDTGTYEKLWMG